MSTLNDPINPLLLGTDLGTTAAGDVAAAGRDWGTVSGTQNVVNAFIRELLTPLGYLARWIYDVDGLKVLNEDYGFGGYAQLSEPLTPDWINSMIEHIEAVAENQSRVQLNAVDYALTNEVVTGIQFSIKFSVLNAPKPFNLILRREGKTLTAGLA